MQRESGRAINLFDAKRSWLLARTLFLVVLLGTLPGCSSTPPPAAGALRPFEGVVVRVSCPGGPAATVVDRYGQSWASQAGARIEVVNYEPEADPESGPAADLWVIPPARMPHWAAAGKLLEIPESLKSPGSGYAWHDILQLYRNKLLIWDQKTYALPLLGDALLFFYRTDLLTEPKERQSFRQQFGHDLPGPNLREITWEQIKELAAFFHNQPRSGSTRGCPSLPPLPISDDELDREFYSVAAPFARQAVEEGARSRTSAELFSFHYDLATGDPRIQTAGFVHGLNLLRQLQPFRPAKASVEPAASFERGEAVLCLANAAWIGRFQRSSQVKGKFGFCRLPGSRHVFDYRTGQEQLVAGGNYVPYLGADGWMSVVPKSNARPEAALALAASLGDPKTSRDIVIEPDWGGGVFRRAHFEADGWQAFGLFGQTEWLVDVLRSTIVHSGMQNPVLRLRIPDEREHQRALVAEVRAALTGGKDAMQALADAARHWQEIDARKDAKARLRDYRLSLSLSGNE